MPGWGKLVAGAVIGAVGALYVTNEDVRKVLPEAARDLPDAVRRRFEAATAAAREASASRRAEILKELEAHGGDHSGRRSLGGAAGAVPTLPAGEGAPSEIPPPRVVQRTEVERTEPAASVEE